MESLDRILLCFMFLHLGSHGMAHAADGDSLPFFGGIDSVVTEDVPMTIDLDRHFHDLDSRKPFLYALAATDTNASYVLEGKLLTIAPRQDYTGLLLFTITAMNQAGTQITGHGILFMNPVNDTPKVVLPFPPIRTGYFDSMIVRPGLHFWDPENGQNLNLGLSWDTTRFFGENRSGTYVFKSNGRPASGIFTARASDWAAIPLARETQFSFFNNDSNRMGVRFRLPVALWGSYLSLPLIQPIDPQQRVLSVRVGDTTSLFDRTRRLITPPFVIAEGMCLIPAPGERRLIVLGKAGFPDTVDRSADAPVEGYWALTRRILPGSHAGNTGACAFTAIPNGYKFARWGGSGGLNRLVSSADSSGAIQAEHQKLYSTSVQVYDVLVQQERVLVLYRERLASGGERDVLWLDILGSDLVSLSAPLRISAYEAPANTAHFNYVPFGKILGTTAGIEVIWGKYDSDNNSLADASTGSKIFRKTFDQSNMNLISTKNLGINNTWATTLRLVSVDRIANDDIRIRWANLYGSCVDQAVGSVRINPLQPDQLYQDSLNIFRPSACNSGINDFGIPFHFEDGSSLVYRASNPPNRYIEFLPPGGIVSLRPGARSASGKAAMVGSRLILEGTRVRAGKGETLYDLSGRKIPSVPGSREAAPKSLPER